MSPIIPKEAIELAITNGYRHNGSIVTVFRRGESLRFKKETYTEAVNTAELALDRKFWKAIGAGLGWGMGLDNTMVFFGEIISGGDGSKFWKEAFSYMKP